MSEPRDSPVRELLTRGSIYTMGLAAQFLSQLVVLPILSRLLDPRDYGLIATCLVVLNLVSVLAMSGVPAAVTWRFFQPGGPTEARRLIVPAALTAIVVTLLVDRTGLYWSAIFRDLDYTAPLMIAVWSAVPLAILMTCQGWLRAADRAGAFLVASLFGGIGGPILGILGVVLVGARPSIYLLGMAIGHALGMAIGLAVVRPPVPGSGDVARLRAAVKYGLPTVPHSLSLFALIAGDRLVIERLLGLAAVGRYHVAYLIGAFGISLLGTVNNAWAPIVYRASDADRYRVLASTTATLLRLAASLAAVVALGAPIALDVLVGPQYNSASLVPVVALLTVAGLSYTSYLSRAQILFQRGSTGHFAWITPVVAAISLLGAFTLIPVWGLVGAALATVLGYTIQYLLVAVMARRVATVPWQHRDTIKAWSLAIAAAAAGSVSPRSGWWLLLRVIAIVVILAFAYRNARALIRR